MAESNLVADLRVAAMFEDTSTAELLKKAADEIERLKREILHYEHQCELGSQKIDSLMKYAERLRQDCIALQGEIGRLTDNNPSPEQTRTEN